MKHSIIIISLLVLFCSCKTHQTASTKDNVIERPPQLSITTVREVPTNTLPVKKEIQEDDILELFDLASY